MKRIKDYLLENTDELMDVVQEINSWNGALDYLEVFENDEEFFNLFYEGNPFEVARAITYGDYHYMDEYVRINAYGNIDSMTDYEYMDMLKNYINDIVDELIDVYYRLYISDKLTELIEEYLEDSGE